ncbi:GerMN domain-containing protein [Bacillus gobiensis]|uniref:GerMN domain-containing protein n=1 Tax=Bacillus gobiensis TaxID=1441095 RepID=UPI003D246F96
MLKKRTFGMAASVCTAMLLLSGCGLFQSDNASEEIDPPEHNITYEDNAEEMEQAKSEETAENGGEASEEQAEIVKTEIYLIDKNGYVVPQTLPLPKNEGIAKKALEYLVTGGPITELLPNGFRAVIPQDTTVSVDIKDGTAIADFSNEFKNYQPEDEQKILQSITWTLTQFPTVDKVKIRMNGHDLKEMPVGGTPITEDLSREDGINLDTASVTDYTATRPLTVYYIGQSDDATYYVPVTERVSTSETNDIKAAVEKLAEGPDAGNKGLLSEFSGDLELASDPTLTDGDLTLDFNEEIYGSADEEKKVISSHVLNSIVLTMTEQPDIKSVSLMVNGKADLETEEGNKLSKPVTRPVQVNTTGF